MNTRSKFAAFAVAMSFCVFLATAAEEQTKVERPQKNESVKIEVIDGAKAAAAEPTVRFVRPRGQPLPPEAFTSPTNFVLLVNHNNALDTKWLEDEADYMQKQLRVSVRQENAEGKIGTDPTAFVAAIRAKHGNNAKIVVVVSEEEGLAPIITSPYGYWSVMDSGWVRKGGVDAEKTNARMARRIFQAIGHCVGAGYRMEREAVMRYTPSPEALDDCLSHGFHPLNSNIFSAVADSIGLDPITLRSRDELIKLGILKPISELSETAPEKDTDGNGSK